MDLRGLVVTKNVYFSLLTHTNQLLLVTLCHTPAGIGNSKVERDDTDARWTDRREGWNSYVDSRILCIYLDALYTYFQNMFNIESPLDFFFTKWASHLVTTALGWTEKGRREATSLLRMKTEFWLRHCIGKHPWMAQRYTKNWLYIQNVLKYYLS